MSPASFSPGAPQRGELLPGPPRAKPRGLHPLTPPKINVFITLQPGFTPSPGAAPAGQRAMLRGCHTPLLNRYTL